MNRPTGSDARRQAVLMQWVAKLVANRRVSRWEIYDRARWLSLDLDDVARIIGPETDRFEPIPDDFAELAHLHGDDGDG